MIGQTLAHYRITAKLGEGGMGEVWRATDTKLDREVAIKVLPGTFTEDPERLARFEREAKVLAQLHHPNIASIFGLEDAAGVRALVMELVEGPTLADRLAAGAIPLSESLAIARQIAEALEEAHEKGIVHRDLKPQNIKASMEGRTKVLDFGLAKAMDPAMGASGSASQLAASPTLTLGATVQGMILGTAAYMAPEQAKGMAVDKRADIWAFGVVLWEMLSGERLFAGDSVPETLAGVLKNEIDFAPLPPETPAAIRRLLRRCLERKPKNRLHDIADARIVIDEALAPGGAVDDEAAAPASSPPSMHRLAPWILLALVVGVAGGWLASRPDGRPAGGAPRFTLRKLTALPGMERQPDLSPDGRQVVYASAASGNLDLYVMRADGGRAINITAGSPADDEQPAFSPDGERLVFRSSRDGGGLFLMGATGESVRRLTDDGFDPAWSPDGQRIAYSMEAAFDPYSRTAPNAALWIVEVASGERRQLEVVDAMQPVWSPDGRRIAYWANSAGQRDLWTLGVDGGEPVAVTDDEATDWSPAWSPDGRWLYFSSDRAGGMNLFRVAIDAATGGAIGDPEPVTTSVGNLGRVRLSADGRRMVVGAYELSAEIELYRLTSGAKPTLRPLRTLRPRSLHWCKLSPDAEWLACSTIGTPEDLVLLRADGSELRKLTDDTFKDRGPEWTNDGTRLLFMSTRAGGKWDVWSLRADGSEPHRITALDSFSASVWSADQRRVTTGVDQAGLIEFDPGQPATRETVRPDPLPDSMPGFMPGGWSPSGRLLGGVEVDAARLALSVGALEPKAGRYRRSELPMAGDGYWKFGGWLADSRHFVAQGRDQIALVDVETGTWRGLLAVDGPVRVVSLSWDASTLLVEKLSADGDLWMLETPEGEP